MSNGLIIARVSWTKIDEFNVSSGLRTSFFCSSWNEAFRTARDFVTENGLGVEEAVRIELRQALTK